MSLQLPVPNGQAAGWVPESVLTLWGRENTCPSRIRNPDRPYCSTSLYRLSYLGSYAFRKREILAGIAQLHVATVMNSLQLPCCKKGKSRSGPRERAVFRRGVFVCCGSINTSNNCNYYKNKLRGLSPLANYTDRATAACSGPRSRPTTSQKIWQRRESSPDLWICSQEL
jgi:hypothetical protein